MKSYDALWETENFIKAGGYLHRSDIEKSVTAVHTGNDIEMLGWTPEEAFETHARLRSFKEDWNYPGMEAYDEL